MRIYAEIYDNYETVKAMDCLMPPGTEPSNSLKDYRLILLDRVKGWRMSVNLTIFILSYPMPKINRLLKLLSEADGSEDAIKGYNHIFECLDYLAKSCNNENKSLLKKLQKLNDYAMGLQSRYNEGG